MNNKASEMSKDLREREMNKNDLWLIIRSFGIGCEFNQAARIEGVLTKCVAECCRHKNGTIHKDFETPGQDVAYK